MSYQKYWTDVLQNESGYDIITLQVPLVQAFVLLAMRTATLEQSIEKRRTPYDTNCHMR